MSFLIVIINVYYFGLASPRNSSESFQAVHQKNMKTEKKADSGLGRLGIGMNVFDVRLGKAKKSKSTLMKVASAQLASGRFSEISFVDLI